MTIGEAKVLATMFSGLPAAGARRALGLQIVVLDRGFVYVGDVVVDGDFCTIADARNVRRWGTTAGLGELAAKGPLKDTILDDAGRVIAPMRAVIHFIACVGPSWKR